MRVLIPSLLTSLVIFSGCSSHHGGCRHQECTAVARTGHAHVTAPAAPECFEQPEEPCTTQEPCVTQEPCAPQPAPVPDKEPTESVTNEPLYKRDYGHAENYSWLMGELHRVHVPGGEWKIRYAPLNQTDAWGGSMVLAPDARLNEFSDGDFVYVEGRILADRPSLYLTGALYRVGSIRSLNSSRLADGAQ